MRSIKLFALIASSVLFFRCEASDPIDPVVDNTIGDLTPKGTGEIVEHTYYKLAYSEDNEQASWVYYMLTTDFISGNISRTDDFRADAKVSTGSASLNDYKGSGYDRGHLCPAADMKLNSTSMSESFYLSNMSPQVASFNRGIWSKLESLVRTWCSVEDTIYVATGPIFRDNIGSIGANGVTVPGYYYKTILDLTGEFKAIALVLPNAGSSNQLSSFVITIDSLEVLTGIDFWPGLPDHIESKIESTVDISTWAWDSSGYIEATTKNAGTELKSTPAPVSQTNQSVQCKGIAKSTGQRCKNRTTNSNGFCHHHQNQAP